MPRKRSAGLPSRKQILDFIATSDQPAGKREIARAFQITGENRILLKDLLKRLEAQGAIEKGGGRRVAPPAALPAVAVLTVVEIDADGETLARPLNWQGEDPPPPIYMQPERRGHPALAPGDKVLAKLQRISDTLYEGRTIRKLDAGAALRMVGTFELGRHGGRQCRADA